MIIMQQTKEKAPCTTAIVQDANKSTNSCIQDTIKQLESQAFDLGSSLSICDIPILDVVNVLYRALECMEDETTIQNGMSEDTMALVFFRRLPAIISMLRISLHELETVPEGIKHYAEQALCISKDLRAICNK